MDYLCEKKSVLIISQNDLLQLELPRILRKENYLVYRAYDGWEGFMDIELKKPDIILLDPSIPGTVKGLEIIKMARAISDLRNIPIMMMIPQSQLKFWMYTNSENQVQGFLIIDDNLDSAVSEIEKVINTVEISN